MKKRSRYINRLIAGFSSINFVYLAALYILAYLAVEILVSDPIRHYNFCVFLALSGIYFSWFIGGRRTMAYVAFFNILFAGIFSKILWDQGIIIYGGGLFLGKSFLGMYALTVVLLFIMLLKKSPADIRAEYQKNTIEQERAHRQNLEFMVATRKLTQDMVAQANMVKDELQLIEGAWKSNVHSIINDLSPVKEEELYRQIILPFQENIIRHLRNLETGLTFDLQPLALTDLYTFLTQKTTGHAAAIEQARQSWQHCAENVVVDKNKIWDMVKNILRNSQAALDLQRLHQLDADPAALTTPRISISFSSDDRSAAIIISDNGGGVAPDRQKQLYVEPVPSCKRGGKKPGQGTLFVKFFAERMGISVSAANTGELGSPGLQVTLRIPINHQGELR